MQFKYFGQGAPGGVSCLAKFHECRLGEDSPAPLSAAAENDLDHGYREKDYHESGDDRGKHRVVQPEPPDEEVGGGYGKQH